MVFETKQIKQVLANNQIEFTDGVISMPVEKIIPYLQAYKSEQVVRVGFKDEEKQIITYLAAQEAQPKSPATLKPPKEPTTIKISGKDYLTHAGLLQLAHEKKIVSITTIPISVVNDQVGIVRTAVFRAEVKTAEFTSNAHADAHIDSVDATMKKCVYRLAETRAVNRALRLLIGTELCSAEELDEN